MLKQSGNSLNAVQYIMCFLKGKQAAMQLSLHINDDKVV